MKKKKLVIISRESNEPSIDIRLLYNELCSRDNIKVVVLCKILEHNYFSYALHMLKQIKEIKTADVVLLDTYCIPASMLKHRKNQTVVQMWHALSAIKKFGWQTVGKSGGRSTKIAKFMKMHHGYDRVICASDVTAKYFCEAFRADPTKIVKLGLPRIDYIKSDRNKKKTEILNRYEGLSNGKKNLLYVPTFRKARPVELEDLIKELDPEKYNLIVKLHPLDELWSGASNNDYLNNTEDGSLFVVLDKDYNSYDMLSIADAVISDYSSFVVEASLLDIPLYLYTYDRVEYENSVGLNVHFAEEPIAHYAFDKAKDLADALEESYDLKALHTFRDKYIDVDTNNCTKQLADFLLECIQE